MDFSVLSLWTDPFPVHVEEVSDHFIIIIIIIIIIFYKKKNTVFKTNNEDSDQTLPTVCQPALYCLFDITNRFFFVFFCCCCFFFFFVFFF